MIDNRAVIIVLGFIETFVAVQQKLFLVGVNSRVFKVILVEVTCFISNFSEKGIGLVCLNFHNFEVIKISGAKKWSRS